MRHIFGPILALFGILAIIGVATGLAYTAGLNAAAVTTVTAATAAGTTTVVPVVAYGWGGMPWFGFGQFLFILVGFFLIVALLRAAFGSGRTTRARLRLGVRAGVRDAATARAAGTGRRAPAELVASLTAQAIRARPGSGADWTSGTGPRTRPPTDRVGPGTPRLDRPGPLRRTDRATAGRLTTPHRRDPAATMPERPKRRLRRRPLLGCTVRCVR